VGRRRLPARHRAPRHARRPAPGIDLSALTPLIRSLALPFVTADLARRADGTWRVIELGDGQVSDRPPTTQAGPFLSAILGGA
jgi:hypothetical protein